MKIIGITGGIGVGKSTILHILEQDYDAYIVETDKLAHQLMLPGKLAYEKIVECFGKEILKDDQSIDRSLLGQLVFRDEMKLKKLNAIVHPAVKEAILQDINKKRAEGVITYYVIEAALLIEDGYKVICDEIWYIYASQEIRLERLLQGRGGTKEKWLQVMNNQSSEEFYRRNCDVIIDNGCSVTKTTETIQELLSKC